MKQKIRSVVQKFIEYCVNPLLEYKTKFSFIISYQRVTLNLNLMLDSKIIEKGQIKIESIWSWRKFRNEKVVITNTGEKLQLIKIG